MTTGSRGARSKVAALKTIGGLFADPPHLFECLDQPIKVLRQELLAKYGVVARPREFVLGDQVAHRLGL